MEFPFRAGLTDSIRNDLPESLEPGRVVMDGRSPLRVLTEGGEIAAVSAGRLRTSGERPVVGDWVGIAHSTCGGPATIHAIAPRRTVLLRRAAGEAHAQQALAANVDLVLVVEGLDRAFNPRRVERFVAAAWESGATPALVLNKADLAGDPEAIVREATRAAPGVEVVAVSAMDGSGADALTALLASGRTGVLVGPSGAGKSTLVNRLLGGEVQRIGAVRREDRRGRHTTTSRRLFPLPGGGALIDGPGVREFGLGDVEKGIERVFADVEALARGCRFRDCMHKAEPGCAVLAAANSGRIEASRLASYHKLQREAAHARAEANVQLAQEERRRWRTIHRAQNALYRRRGR